MVIIYKNVGIIENITKVRIAKNLLMIICWHEIGFVIKISIVPVLYSPANVCMLIAEIKSRNNIGETVKKASIDA